MAKVKIPRWGWALTGSGHFFKECLVAVRALEDVDLFVSKAAAEVLRMYKQDLSLPKATRIFRDTTAPGRVLLLRRLPHLGAGAGDFEHRGEMRLWDFR
jgi:hypothetical protein